MRLAVTRSAEQLERLRETAGIKQIELVPLPLLKSTPLPFKLPDKVQLNQPDWVVFTSANGVESFFKRIDELLFKLPYQCKIAAIGSRTAGLICSFGYTVDFIPSEATGKSLFTEFITEMVHENESVVYARGADVNFDPADLFAGSTIHYHPVICYEIVPGEIESSQVASLTANDFLLVTAPAAVQAFHSAFGTPNPQPIAIGKTTAAEMDRHGWLNYRILKKADIESVWECI